MTEHRPKAVALSIGDGPDRAKLGFPAAELQHAEDLISIFKRKLLGMTRQQIRASKHA